jgi:hypothetical protein
VDGTWLDGRRRRHGNHPYRPAPGQSRVNIAAYTLLPFGYKAVPRDEYLCREDVGTGPLGVIGNIVWLLLAGWWLALGHLVTAILLAVTVVGIPFAWAHLLPGWPVADREGDRAVPGCAAAAGSLRASGAGSGRKGLEPCDFIFGHTCLHNPVSAQISL